VSVVVPAVHSAATEPWRSKTTQATVLPFLTASLEPSRSSRLLVPELLVSNAVSVGPT
jgi:hypothetical protein